MKLPVQKLYFLRHFIVLKIQNFLLLNFEKSGDFYFYREGRERVSKSGDLISRREYHRYEMMYLRVDQQGILDAFSLNVLCSLLLSERTILLRTADRELSKHEILKVYFVAILILDT
jgi:hypothetical protein